MFRIACSFLLFVLLSVPCPGAGFGPVTAEEKALQSVAAFPNAPAVVLFERGEFRMANLSRGDQTSTLTVETRIKILTEEGKQRYGDVAVHHSRFVRLKDLSGRTLLPDGRIVPLAEDSVFVRKSSTSRRELVTTATFPALEVGAILDYRYQIKFDSIYYLEPWSFQGEIPVLRSEITYTLPREMSARAWQRDPMRVGIQISDQRGAATIDITAVGTNLPPLPEDPHSLPANDLSARFMAVPTVFAGETRLLDTWGTTCELVEDGNYNDALRNDTAARAEAKKIAQAAGAKAPRDTAVALFQFVRDTIETDPVPGVLIGLKEGPDTVLRNRRGDYASKPLLLYTLLDAAKVPARIVWAASRRDGTVDLQMPSFNWFDRMLVQVRIGSEVLYLDPSEKELAFGSLLPDYEGTPALLFDRRKPETLTLPETTFDQNQRHAKVELELDAEGRVRGKGSVTFTGHHAALRLADARAAEGGSQKGWQSWIEERWPGFEVSGVEIQETPNERRASVSFQLAQHEEEALGDQTSLSPSRPLGPMRQILPQPPGQRRTPVVFEFGDRDLLELTLRWPEGWSLDVQPPNRVQDAAAGAFSTQWDVNDDARTLSLRRQLDIKQRELTTREDYQTLQTLFALAERSDAQSIVLVRR